MKTLNLSKKLALVFVTCFTVSTAMNLGYKSYKKQQALEPQNEGIIRIYNIVEGRNGTCSAFVIDDELAITAEHCAELTLDGKISAINMLTEEIIDLTNKVKELYKINTPQAKMVLFQSVIQLRMKKILLSEVHVAEIDKFKIYNTKGEDTTLYAEAFRSSKDDGYTILRGDFRNFKKLDVNILTFTLAPGENLRHCGYPRGSKFMACTKGHYVGNAYLLGESTAALFEGMSGGPVFDSSGKVVGINEGAYKSNTGFNYIFGINSDR